MWKLVQEQLSRCLQQLQDEKAKTDAHVQSLKKRRANLTVSTRTFLTTGRGARLTSDPAFLLKKSTGAMKQQVREHFDSMRRVLEQDEQDILESLELDLRQARTRLDQVLQDWIHHQEQLGKHISRTQKSKPAAEHDGKVRIQLRVSLLSMKNNVCALN